MMGLDMILRISASESSGASATAAAMVDMDLHSRPQDAESESALAKPPALPDGLAWSGNAQYADMRWITVS